MFGKTAVFLFVASGLVATTQAQSTHDGVRHLGVDYSCCVDSTCGGDMGEFAGAQCAPSGNDPNASCPNDKPTLCERIVCCMEEGCGGACAEDRYAAGQCLGKMDYGHICTEQAYQCCQDDGCTTCKQSQSRVEYGEAAACDDNNDANNFPELCETTFCCENPDCTVCSSTGQTAERCEIVGGYVCASGGGGGDPHINTWNHKWFDFHGVCDLVLVDAPKFENLGLKVVVRTSARYEYSFISQAVLKIGTDALEVTSYGDYSVNGVTSAAMPNMLSGYPITHTKINKKKHVFHVDIGPGEGVTITTFKDLVSVSFDSASSADFHGSVGLMGEFGTGKKLARDGITIIEDPIEFGKEWQVRDTEENLFESARAPQYPEQCIFHSAAQEESRTRRLGESKSRATAEEACAWWGEGSARCVFDVLISGDIELAEAGP